MGLYMQATYGMIKWIKTCNSKEGALSPECDDQAQVSALLLIISLLGKIIEINPHSTYAQ